MDKELLLVIEFMKTHPVEAARILEGIPAEESGSFLEKVPVPVGAQILRTFDLFSATYCLDAMDLKRAGILVSELPAEIGASMLRLLPEKKIHDILDDIPKELSDHIKLLLSFPEGSAGAMMTPQVLSLPEDVTVKEALMRIEQFPRQVIYYIYIVNRTRQLTGVVNMGELMLADNDQALALIMNKLVTYLSAEDGTERILAHPGWFDHHALPVVDQDGILLGAIRYGTIRRLEREKKASKINKEESRAGLAFGELFRIGLDGMVRGAANAFSREED